MKAIDNYKQLIKDFILIDIMEAPPTSNIEKAEIFKSCENYYFILDQIEISKAYSSPEAAAHVLYKNGFRY